MYITVYTRTCVPNVHDTVQDTVNTCTLPYIHVHIPNVPDTIQNACTHTLYTCTWRYVIFILSLPLPGVKHVPTLQCCHILIIT